MKNEKIEAGLATFSELMGNDAAQHLRAAIDSDTVGSGLAELAAQYAFGSVWSRDGLDRKARSLVTVAVLIAQRQVDELKNHFRIGLNNGLSPAELEEAVIQTAPYCGFPAAAAAAGALVEVLREKGLDSRSATASERGLV